MMEVKVALNSKINSKLASKVQARVTQVNHTIIFSLTQFLLLLLGDKEPLLYVDVNLGNTGTQRIVVYDGETAEKLAEDFAKKWNLDSAMQIRLTDMLQQQISGVLEKIEEEHSNNSDNVVND